MNNLFLFILMVFCHIIDDYTLQGWLASAKQKEWWKDNAPNKLYKYDYLCALIMHSISWSFMIMLPIAYMCNFNINTMFLIVFISNVILHAQIDNMKANKRQINLWVDQILHIVQIGVTFLYYVLGHFN